MWWSGVKHPCAEEMVNIKPAVGTSRKRTMCLQAEGTHREEAGPGQV